MSECLVSDSWRPGWTSIKGSWHRKPWHHQRTMLYNWRFTFHLNICWFNEAAVWTSLLKLENNTLPQRKKDSEVWSWNAQGIRAAKCTIFVFFGIRGILSLQSLRSWRQPLIHEVVTKSMREKSVLFGAVWCPKGRAIENHVELTFFSVVLSALPVNSTWGSPSYADNFCAHVLWDCRTEMKVFLVWISGHVSSCFGFFARLLFQHTSTCCVHICLNISKIAKQRSYSSHYVWWCVLVLAFLVDWGKIWLFVRNGMKWGQEATASDYKWRFGWGQFEPMSFQLKLPAYSSRGMPSFVSIRWDFWGQIGQNRARLCRGSAEPGHGPAVSRPLGPCVWSRQFLAMCPLRKNSSSDFLFCCVSRRLEVLSWSGGQFQHWDRVFLVSDLDRSEAQETEKGKPSRF